jgi:hypothetical protein
MAPNIRKSLLCVNKKSSICVPYKKFYFLNNKIWVLPKAIRSISHAVIYSGESIHKHEYFPEFASKNKNLFGIRVRVLLGAYLYRKTYLKNLFSMSLLTFGGKSLLKYRKLVECRMCYLNWKRYQLNENQA